MPDQTSDGRLQCLNTSGFNGNLPNGIIVHPDGHHIIYASGCNVIVENITSPNIETLWGHDNAVTCLAVSHSGRYLASGQVTHTGFKASIIVWDFETKSIYCRFKVLHKVKVEALAFSPSDMYLLSLGGIDDGTIVVWNVANKEAICGSQAQVESAGSTNCIVFANKIENDCVFASAGDGTLRIWSLDVANRKIKPTDVMLGQVKRTVTCLAISDNDETMYCGTSTGDIMAVNISSHRLQAIGPKNKKELFCMGITALAPISNGEILVGAGDGTVGFVKPVDGEFKRLKGRCAQVEQDVTSIALRGSGHQFFVGTKASHIYKFTFADFDHELYKTSHKSGIKDICFTYGASELFLTCGHEDVRVWLTSNMKELLRITVPNMTCNVVAVPRDGKSIVTGWSDSKIRAYSPETGKLMYEISDAVNREVTALCLTNSGNEIICGGGNGEVRRFVVEMQYTHKGCVPVPKFLYGLKEHKAAITSIKMCSFENQCISASEDGTCIIWDLQKRKRLHMLKSNTVFKYTAVHPCEYQFLTCGTDRKINYYDSNEMDASIVRVLEGSQSGAVNGVDISPSLDGTFFVTGGEDKLVKVWDYNSGEVKSIGVGHSASIQRVKICPNMRYIVSVGDDGAIFVWNCSRI